jgi:hypothetical protein
MQRDRAATKDKLAAKKRKRSPRKSPFDLQLAGVAHAIQIACKWSAADGRMRAADKRRVELSFQTQLLRGKTPIL